MRRMLAETRMDQHTLEWMAADMTTPRLSGPCSHGDRHYCLGARNYQSPVCLNNIHVTCLSRECTCDCHRQPPIQPSATAAALAVKGTRS